MGKKFSVLSLGMPQESSRLPAYPGRQKLERGALVLGRLVFRDPPQTLGLNPGRFPCDASTGTKGQEQFEVDHPRPHPEPS